MNISDMLSTLKKDCSASLSGKITYNNEIRKIEKRAEGFADEVACWIGDEARYIEQGCSYGAPNCCLSDEDREKLLNKLKEVSKTISSKVKETVDQLFDGTEEKEEEKTEEPKENKDEAVVKQVEVEIQPQTQQPMVPKFSAFGY